MNRRLLAVMIMVPLLLSSALANNEYQQEQMRLDSDAQAFVQAESVMPVDPDALTDEGYYSPRNFPTVPGSQETLRLPDADLDAVTRALLILEAHEPPLPHVRYLISYSMNASADFPEAHHDYVEITRFNLGPARRADVLEFVSEEHVAAPTEFGVGPHVSWRFATAPVMGMQAGLMYVGRKEISEHQAQDINCLGMPCLALTDPGGPGSGWNPEVPPLLGQAPYIDKSPAGSTRPARVVQELWMSIASNGMDPLPYRQGQPHFVFVVSVDVSGQESVVAGLVQQAMVMDHTVKEIWTRRSEVAQAPVEFARVYVPRH